MGMIHIQAQDASFTNYINTPLQTNPALVAFDNDLKINLNYRVRFSKFAQSYNMPALSVVHPLINQDKSIRWGGLGFSIISDKSDNSNMIKTTGASLAFAYNLKITNTQFVSASLGAGFYRREANLSHMSTGSQYVPNQGYDPSIPLNETFTNDTKGFLDLSTGIVWQLLDKSGNTKAFAGISVFHLNSPDISLNEEADELPYRYSMQLAYRVFQNEKLDIYPDVSFDYQARILHYNAGVCFKLPFKTSEQSFLKNSSLSFDPRYISDKLFSVGLEFRKTDYVIGFIYDFSIANTNLTDAYELHVAYKRNLFKPKQIKEKIIEDNHYIVGEERTFNKNTEVLVVRDTVYVEDPSKLVEKEWSKKLSDPERKITFNYKSDKFEEEAKNELNEIVSLLKLNDDYVIEIEGHTDNIGDNESNRRQSLRRAQAISDYLVKQDISKGRIRVIGRGASKPIATNATEEGRAKNRRVEFRLYRVIK
jgi:type IX secretion system PorP/SprF family membrane protein